MSVGDVRTYAPGQTGEIDLCTLGSRVVWNTGGLDAAVVQLARPGTAYPSSAVATVKGSNDGLTWLAIDGGVTALSAAGATNPFDTTGFQYVCLETTTAGSGTAPIPFNATLFGRPGVKA
jgi:hypothetical protein